MQSLPDYTVILPIHLLDMELLVFMRQQLLELDMVMELEVALFWLKQKQMRKQNMEETITREVGEVIIGADMEVDITTRRGITIGVMETITEGIITTKKTTIARTDAEIATAKETNITTELETGKYT